MAMVRAGMVIKRGVRDLLNLIYPAYCLQCDHPLSQPSQIVCRECFSQLQWLDPSECCTYCGVPLESQTCCNRCTHTPCDLQPYVPLFKGEGVMPYLCCGAFERDAEILLASLVVLGLKRLSWPDSDCIVPLLLPRSQAFFVKRQLAFRLARSVAKLLRVPCYVPSTRVAGKTILLLTDHLQQGNTLYEIQEELKSLGARKVYSLALMDGRY